MELPLGWRPADMKAYVDKMAELRILDLNRLGPDLFQIIRISKSLRADQSQEARLGEKDEGN